MAIQQTEDLRIHAIGEVPTPKSIHEELPISAKAATLVGKTRAAIHRILVGEDNRLLVVVGPCSIHDPQAAKEYAAKLKVLRDELGDSLLIVMRVYFEKPRTTVGWKGLINDPDLDGSFNIIKGLRVARELLLSLHESGMPAGTEFLETITPQYFADLVSWGAIGARTTESQIHRELASGLSCPIGFKNGTDGGYQIAVDAVRAARHPHAFLALTQDARSAIFRTTGNQDTHIILRGGKQPNYDRQSVHEARDQLTNVKLEPRVMVDFSHANSLKQPERQVLVAEDVAGQLESGDPAIMGVMVESHLKAGRQDHKPDVPLEYGVSITDGCIGWEETEGVLRRLSAASATRQQAAS